MVLEESRSCRLARRMINAWDKRYCRAAEPKPRQTVGSHFVHFMDFVAREPFLAVCTITGARIVGLLFRPMRLPEAMWACLGALALILLHLISWDHTLLAVSKGIDVYLFLAGMILPTCLAAVTAIILVALKDRQAPINVVREVSWSVILLVAGLFVIVKALKDAGTLRIAQTGLEMVSRWPVFRGDLTGLSVSL
jgi:Na+/H+ antiporter NhaD/arsenite permease-like protein